MRIINYIVVFLLVATTATAQLGVRAGLNLGGPIGKLDGAKGFPIPGPQAGLYYNLKLNQRWGVNMDVLYSFRGAGYSSSARGDSTIYIQVGPGLVPVSTNFTSEVNGKMMLHYLDIPLQVEYKYGKSQRWSVTAGIMLSYLFAGEDKGITKVIFVEGGQFNQTINYNNINEINKLDYAVTLGGTYQLPRGFNVSLRASRGFVPLYPASFFVARNTTPTKINNTFMHFTAGYTIPWKKKKKSQS